MGPTSDLDQSDFNTGNLLARWASTLGSDPGEHDPERSYRWRGVDGPEVDLSCDSVTPVPPPRRRVDATSSTIDPPSDLEGALLVPPAEPSAEEFQPLGLIGRGGMGEVFRARQSDLEREVALKKLRRDRLESAPARAAFLAEAAVNGLLEHPNIAPVYSLGRGPDGAFHLAMKLVGGRSWADLLKAALGDTAEPAGLPRDALLHHLEILRQVCNAVAYAHSREIVHNDLKPANVMVGEYGEVIVLDWGIAVHCGEAPRASSRIRHRSTITGPLGTPSYMAPELALGRGDSVGPWTDIYLLGAILYELLTGRAPHRGKSVAEAIRLASAGAPLPFPEGVPADLAALCRKALSFHPAERPRDVGAFQAGLRDHLVRRESVDLAQDGRRKLAEMQSAPAAAPERDQDAPDERSRFALYDGYSEAVATFRQAVRLWEDNADARRGERDAKVAYAAAAVERGDLGLAEAQLAGTADGDDTALLRRKIALVRLDHEAKDRARRRMKGALLAASLVILGGLVAGVVVLGWKNSDIARGLARLDERNAQIEAQNRALALEKDRVEDARRLAESERELAERRGEIAGETLDRLVVEIQDVFRVELADERSLRASKLLLERALEGWEALRQTELAEGQVTRGRALVRLRIGLLERDQGKEGWLEEIEAAAKILRDLAEADPESAILRGDLAHALRVLGDARTSRGLHDEAVAFYEDALRTLDGVSEAASWRERAAVSERLGLMRQTRGDLAGARELYIRVLDLHRAAYEADSTNLAARGGEAMALRLVGAIDELSGDVTSAEILYSAAVEAQRAIAEADPSSTVHAESLLRGLQQLGYLREGQGDLAGAAQAFGEAYGYALRILALAPATPANSHLMAQVETERGRVLWRLGDAESGRALVDEAVKVLTRLVVIDGENFLYRRDLARALDVLADADRALEPARADEVERRALRLRRQLHAANPTDVEAAWDLCSSLSRRSSALLSAGEAESALVYAREHSRAAEELRRNRAEDVRSVEAGAFAAEDLADALLQLGRRAEAESAALVAHSIRTELLSLDESNAAAHRGFCASLVRLAEIDLLQDRPRAAEPRFMQALDGLMALEARMPENPELGRMVALTLAGLGSTRLAKGDATGALTSLAEARRAVVRLADATPEDAVTLAALLEISLRLAMAADGAVRPQDGAAALEDTIRRLQAAPRLPPHLAAKLPLLQGNLEQLRAWAEALPFLEGKAVPGTARERELHAVGLFRSERFAEAVAAFERVFADGSGDLSNFLFAAKAAVGAGRHELAYAWLESCIRPLREAALEARTEGAPEAATYEAMLEALRGDPAWTGLDAARVDRIFSGP